MGLLGVGRLEAAQVQLVSRADPAIYTSVGGNFSDAGKVTADGRYVVFESLAGNLTLTPPARENLGNYVNIYLRDLLTGVTQLLSVNHAGIQGGLGDSTNPSISPDGRYVVFESDADDLVVNDTNGVTDVFLRDLQTGETKLVSARPDGQSGDDASYNPSLSPDGRYVVFESDATDLSPGDQNGLTDVLRRDMQTGTIVRVSAGAADPSGNSYSSDPSMSDDGQTVAFVSSAAFPALGVTNLSAKVVIRDLSQDKWTVLTNELLLAAGKAQGFGQNIAPDSTPPSLSADGQFVTFKNDSWVFVYDRGAAKVTVVATNALVIDPADDETGPFITAHGQKVVYAAVPQDVAEIFVWDRATGKSTLVSANADGAPADSGCDSERISADGQHVVFVSDATNLVPGADDGSFQVYWRDLSTNGVRLVGVAPGGGPGGSVENTVPSISADGRVVVFDADDGPLVPGDNNHEADVFAVDMSSNAVRLVSARLPALVSVTGNLANSAPISALSADGQRAAFLSWSDNLIAGDTNQTQDIFVFDLARQTITLVNATPAGTSSAVGGDRFALSADGHVVVFPSAATDLVSTPVTNSAINLFWRDLDQAKTQLLTVSYDGQAASSGTVDSPVSGSATVSQNGQRVAFISSATNLVQAPTPDGSLNLLFRDIQTQTTRLVDQGYVASPVLTPDGARVLYWKHPSQNSPVPPAQLLLWDAAAGTNRVVLEIPDAGVGQVSPLSVSAAGDAGVFEVRSTGNVRRVEWVRFSDGSQKSVTELGNGVETTNVTPTAAMISGDGSSVLFTSSEARYLGGIQSGFQNVFVRNLQTGALTLVSASQKGPAADGDSRNAVISADGRYVAFQSDADDLVANDTNQVTDVFLRDLVARTTTLLSATPAGAVGNSPSIRPWMNAAGDVVLFTSAASDLISGDYNENTDVFVVPLAAPSLQQALLQQGKLNVQFSSRVDRKYRIESAADVAAGPWTLVQEVTATGASTTLSLPATGSRQFYRITLEP